MNIDPRGLTVIQWTDAMTLELTGLSSPPRVDSAATWQQWALLVSQSPEISTHNPPNPLTYTDWREWAERFNQTVPLT